MDYKIADCSEMSEQANVLVFVGVEDVERSEGDSCFDKGIVLVGRVNVRDGADRIEDRKVADFGTWFEGRRKFGRKRVDGRIGFDSVRMRAVRDYEIDETHAV
jgi:hypothetical protein